MDDPAVIRQILVAEQLAGQNEEPTLVQLWLWTRWAEAVLWALDEYRARGLDDTVGLLERLLENAKGRVDQESLQKAEVLLAKESTGERPSMSHGDARRILRTDQSGNPYA